MNIYIYPISDPNKSVSKNPYIDDLIQGLQKHDCNIVNKNKLTRFGIFDLLVYWFKTDVYYLNWIENLPDRRFGWIQALLFYLIFLILKLSGKKIVWMMHNKLSHSKQALFLKMITNYLLINYADLVLTHSKEGVRFGNIFMRHQREILFRHHPLEQKAIKADNTTEKTIDILIWGSIAPYKGIDTFLEYLKKSDAYEKYRIHIVGKITQEALAKRLKSYQGKALVIEDDFVSNERLQTLFSKSHLVLFTYAGYSTLSSGALMDTLAYGKKIIGPDVGAFRDLKEEGLIETFTDFDRLIEKLERGLDVDINYHEKLRQFIEENSWDHFTALVCQKLYQKV